MQNIIPTAVTLLLALAERMAAGAASLGILAQNTAAKILADLTALATASDNYEKGKALLGDRHKVIASLVATSRAFLKLYRELLKPTFGDRYSRVWDVTGFVKSLAIPKDPAVLLERLRTAKVFLTAHPEMEVDLKNITAAYADGLNSDLKSAITLADDQDSVVKDLLIERRQAQKVLHQRVRGTIDELDQLLGALDPRWAKFGLNMPGAPATPDAPVGLRVVSIKAGSVELAWTNTARADRYRLYKKVVGVDEDFIAVSSRDVADGTLSGLPANAAVEIAVSAVNLGGESPLSAFVTVQTQ